MLPCKTLLKLFFSSHPTASVRWHFRMDVKSVAELLRGTIDPNLRSEAEKKLQEVHKIIGFAPVLLQVPEKIMPCNNCDITSLVFQVVMEQQVELPVRQAAVIYLKNLVSGSWQDREADTPGAPVPFAVHEQDRAVIRDNIVDAVVRSPDIIKIQLAVCVSQIGNSHHHPRAWH